MKISTQFRFSKKPVQVKRALISVFDKSGVIDLATALHESGTELISTGGTAKLLREAGIPVKDVQEITGFPECLEGRVKTLHPKIHGGILGRHEFSSDREDMEKMEIDPIQLVVVNLYPFETVAESEPDPETVMENIDIGGPAMLRAAAKNVDNVCVLSSPDQYEGFISELKKEQVISFETRAKLSAGAFALTASYDTAISKWFSRSDSKGDMKSESDFESGEAFSVSVSGKQMLRYGENPHQKAAVYGKQNSIIDCFHGKQLSYNNYLDVDAALNLLDDFKNEPPTCIIVKHTLACGVAVADRLSDAWEKAFATDTKSPFGGIIAVNRTLDKKTAQMIDKIFSEIIIAPDYEPAALELLQQKANRRLIRLKSQVKPETDLQIKSVFGGILVQEKDNLITPQQDYQIVTKLKPTAAQLRDLTFAWKVAKRVNSNAIVFAKNLQTLGIGSGQPSRVDASEIAISKAAKFGHSLYGSAIASDAFFPFADGIVAAAKAGARTVIQPGGSVRDKEVIEAADFHEMSMIFTGIRHFKH